MIRAYQDEQALEDLALVDTLGAAALPTIASCY